MDNKEPSVNFLGHLGSNISISSIFVWGVKNLDSRVQIGFELDLPKIAWNQLILLRVNIWALNGSHSIFRTTQDNRILFSDFLVLICKLKINRLLSIFRVTQDLRIQFSDFWVPILKSALDPKMKFFHKKGLTFLRLPKWVLMTWNDNKGPSVAY